MNHRRSTDPALRLIAVTPGVGSADELVARAMAALKGGATTIWVRERQRPEQELREVLEALQRGAAATGGAVVVSARPDLAVELGLSGAQLGFRDETVPSVRRAFGRSIRLGYSAHDPLDSAAVAAADFITLSPVFPTTKPDSSPPATPMGLARFAALTAIAARPVVALGGVDAATVRAVIHAGACGVAVMGAIFGMAAVSEVSDVADAAASLRALVERALEEVAGPNDGAGLRGEA